MTTSATRPEEKREESIFDPSLFDFRLIISFICILDLSYLLYLSLDTLGPESKLLEDSAQSHYRPTMAPFSDHNHMLAYTHIPTAAFRVPDPKLVTSTDTHEPVDSLSTGEKSTFRSRLASFPPNNVASAGQGGKRGTGLAGTLGTTGGIKDSTGVTGGSGGAGGIGSALSSGVTDMFISHLLPSALPSKATPQAPLPQPGKIRALSSQRESLSLPGMTNSFRRFVARCGTIFWVEDRVEEVLYWRKPVWTWAWMLLWSFICGFETGGAE
jgi:hypothetical protein